MPAFKRPAAAATAASRKVAKVSQKQEAPQRPPSNRDLVLKALQECEDIPAGCRAMLCAALPNCAVPERHAAQDMMLQMIEEALQARESVVRGRSETAESAALGAKSRSEAQQQAVDASKAAADDAAKACSEKMMALGQAKEAHDAAQASEAQAAAALSGHVRQFEALSKKRSDLQELVEAKVASLKEAASSSSDIHAVLAKWAPFNFDAGMLASLPCILGKAPEARGDFDEVVLQQLAGSIQEQRSKIDAELAAGEGERQRLESEKARAEEATVAALATQQARLQDVESAKESVQKAESVTQAALAEARSCNAAAEAAEAEATLRRAQQEEFQRGPMVAFQELRDGPKAEAVEVAEVAEVAETLGEAVDDGAEKSMAETEAEPPVAEGKMIEADVVVSNGLQVAEAMATCGA